MLHFVFIGSLIPYAFLLKAAVLFAVLTTGMLLFIFFYLHASSKRRRRKKELCNLFSDLIAETTICETEEERREVFYRFLGLHGPLVQQPFPRTVLIRELVRTKDQISGGAAFNLQWLYETLDLDRDTLKNFLSPHWHRKARAIQHLAEMQQSKHLVKIYRETNNPNAFIRTEAQLAVVKLTGFKGLRFLNIVSHPVSQWQQLALLDQLKEGDIEEAKIETWLQSANDTVVEFALRLVEVYKCFALHDAVVKCLHHSSPVVRLQALQALKETGDHATCKVLLQHFDGSSKEEQLAMLDVLPALEAGNSELSFLSSLLLHPEEAIRYRALNLVQQICPKWSTEVNWRISDLPARYLLFSPEKRAV